MLATLFLPSGEEEMKDFLKQNGENEHLFEKVKIKINNERAKLTKRLKKRKTEMEL